MDTGPLDTTRRDGELGLAGPISGARQETGFQRIHFFQFTVGLRTLRCESRASSRLGGCSTAETRSCQSQIWVTWPPFLECFHGRDDLKGFWAPRRRPGNLQDLVLSLELDFLEHSIIGAVLLCPSAFLMFLGRPLAPVVKVYPPRTPWIPMWNPVSPSFSWRRSLGRGTPACLHPVEVCFKPKATSCLHQQVQKRSKARAGEFRGQELRMAIQPPCHGRVEA